MTRGSADESTNRYRRSLELDGSWQFLTDPDNSGRTSRWYESDATWPARAHTVELPRAWQEDEAYREYTGTAWYRRTVDLGATDWIDLALGSESTARAFLVFDAVDYETTVWVNGEHVGENRGGYLPFEFDVTDALEAGENVIVLSVSDPADLSELPHGKQGDPWYTRVSGVWQSVRLEMRPATRVVDARVTPDLERDRAVVDLAVEPGSVDPESVTATIEAKLDENTDASATVSLGDGRNGTADDAADQSGADERAGETEAPAVLEFDDPTYWHPDDPALYDLTVTLERNGTTVDRYEDYFGLRSFAVDDGEFLLNGEPITLRGVLEQGYYPETLYRPPSDATFENEIELAADLGFNLIRKHVKPAHPDFLEHADRAGMLVWQEPANPMQYTDRSRAEVRQQLADLVDRDYNRPSVVIWSMYNEEWGIGHHDTDETLWTDEGKQRFLADCYEWLRERDPTRVVCDNSGWAHVATDINDYHRYFVSPDQADSWVADLEHIRHYPGDNYATNRFDEPDAPIVVSELGTWGLCDVDTLRERYDGDPDWFDHDFLHETLKRPDGVDDRFDRTTLPDVFDGYADLANAWQEREFTSIKHLLEEMRVREDIAGYVLTELSDIEWEFNGLADYHRNPKSFASNLSAVNGPISIVVRPTSHVAQTDQSIETALTVVNDTGAEISGTVEWSLGQQRDAAGEDGSSAVDTDINVRSESISVPAHGTTTLETTLSVPDTTAFEDEQTVRQLVISASFASDSTAVATTEPITVVKRDRDTVPSATVYAEGPFASRLAEAGVSITHTLTDAVDIAVTPEITSRVDRFASEGGAVVHVPDRDGEMQTGGPFTYRSLPRTESWDIAAGFYYQDSPLLENICPDRHLGWEFENLYPHAVATGLNPSADRVHIGYVEGWMGNWSSPFVTRGYGNGSMTALTLPITDRYGRQPVATLLCDRLLDWFSRKR